VLIGVLVLAGVAVFWCAILVAAALEPGYRQWRDYVSVLAAHGAEHPALAILGIVAAAAAMLFASFLLWRISRVAGLALGLAGVGFVVVAFTRLDCPNGAAACGLGGRFEISGSTEIGHWTATTVSTALVIAAMALTGRALLRQRRIAAGAVTVAAAVVTTGAFLATGGDNPGIRERFGIAVATGWLAAVGVAALVRARERSRDYA
jgi:hypothetical protein